MQDNEVKVINNEYDFSNIIVDGDHTKYLVYYLDGLNKQLKKLIEDDEEKNKQFKDEYKVYNYKKNYKNNFIIRVRFENFSNNFECKDYESFESAINNNSIKNIRELSIELDFSYDSGSYNNYVEHENNFIIRMKPYDIKFIRNSNLNDESMNQVEKQILEIMNKFQVVNTLFCSK